MCSKKMSKANEIYPKVNHALRLLYKNQHLRRNWGQKWLSKKGAGNETKEKVVGPYEKALGDGCSVGIRVSIVILHIPQIKYYFLYFLYI